MLSYISWSTYGTGLAFLVTAYYAYVIWRFYRPRSAREQEPVEAPLEKEEWMDHVLHELEDTLVHAQLKRYTPDDLMKAIQNKLTELKQSPIKSSLE